PTSANADARLRPGGLAAAGSRYARQAGLAPASGDTLMTAFLAQLLNGLDKGGAYALIALGLTLVFGTLGVVNFAHGALFILGCFCAVTFRYLITLETVTIDPEQLSPW